MKKFLMMLFLLIVLFTVTCQAEIQVKVLSNTVLVMQPDGKWNSAPDKGKVNFGSTLKTAQKGRAQIEYPDGSQILLNPGTFLTVMEQGIIMKNGTATYNFKKQGKSFIIQLPGALLSVLGTRFTIDVQSKFSVVSMIEGSVKVTLGAGGIRVLKAGERLKFGPDGKELVSGSPGLDSEENDPGQPRQPADYIEYGDGTEPGPGEEEESEALVIDRQPDVPATSPAWLSSVPADRPGAVRDRGTRTPGGTGHDDPDFPAEGNPVPEVDWTVGNNTGEVSESLFGDLDGNGTVDSEDSEAIKAHLEGTGALTDSDLKKADLDGNGTVDYSDLEALSFYAGGTGDVNSDGAIDGKDVRDLEQAIQAGDRDPVWDINSDGKNDFSDVGRLKKMLLNPGIAKIGQPVTAPSQAGSVTEFVRANVVPTNTLYPGGLAAGRQADGFSLLWWDLKKDLVEVEAKLEVSPVPASDSLLNLHRMWVLAAAVADRSGKVIAYIHLGLMWDTRFPGNRSVLFGGNLPGQGTSLNGTVSALPSPIQAANMREYPWKDNNFVHLQIKWISPGVWGGYVDGVLVRKLSSSSCILKNVCVWTGSYCRQDAPAHQVTWKDIGGVDTLGNRIEPEFLRVRYHAVNKGGLNNTNSRRIENPVRFVQETNTARTVSDYTLLSTVAAPVSNPPSGNTGGTPPWKPLSTDQFVSDMTGFGFQVTGTGGEASRKYFKNGVEVPYQDLVNFLPPDKYFKDSQGYHYIQTPGAVNPKTGEIADASGKTPSAYSSPSTSGGGLASGTLQELAQKVLDRAADSTNTFNLYTRPRTECIEKLASGSTSIKCGNGTTTTVDPQLLRTILALEASGGIVDICGVTDGSHTTNSAHWKGCAADIWTDPYSLSNAQKIFRYIYENRKRFGIGSLIFDPVPSGCSNMYNGKDNSQSAYLASHRNHIHFSILPGTASSGGSSTGNNTNSNNSSNSGNTGGSSGSDPFKGAAIPPIMDTAFQKAMNSEWNQSGKCLQFAGTMGKHAGGKGGIYPFQDYPAITVCRGWSIKDLPKAAQQGLLKPGMLLHVKIHWDRDPAYHVNDDAHHWFVYMGIDPSGVARFADRSGKDQTADRMYGRMAGWSNSKKYGDARYGYVPKITAFHDPFAARR